MGSGRDEQVGQLSGLVTAILNSQSNVNPDLRLDQHKTPAFSVDELNALINSNFNSASGTAIGQLGAQNERTAGLAGRAAYSQGASRGLTNPYTGVNRAMGQAFDSGNNEMGSLISQLAMGKLNTLNQSPLTSWNMQRSGNQDHINAILQLLNLKGGLAAQRTGGAGDWLPGLIQGGVQVGAAALGKP
jgi:hypothetical protein